MKSKLKKLIQHRLYDIVGDEQFLGWPSVVADRIKARIGEQIEEYRDFTI